MMLSTPHPAGITGRRGFRRLLVIAILIGTAGLASALPQSLDGFGLVAVLVLTTLDLMLIGATRGLAFTRGDSLDERERALRDHAYRVGFRWLGLAVVSLLVVFIFSTIGAAAISAVSGGAPASASDLNTGIAGRVLFAVIELLCIVPTMVIAWAQPDGSEQPDPTQTSTRGHRRALSLMWLLLPALIALWVLDVTLVPVQAASRNPIDSSPTVQGSCRQFVSGRVVGGPFGATVGLEASVCWNGTSAFISDDSSLASCTAGTNDDFASVAETCTTSTDSDGTLRYVVRARVSPLPFSIAARDIAMTLVVARDGTVITQP